MTTDAKQSSKGPAGRPSQRAIVSDGAEKAADKGADKGERRDRHAVTDKRDAIMDAALELFVERGFCGTAVPEIADQAGVVAATIYRYSESHDALGNGV